MDVKVRAVGRDRRRCPYCRLELAGEEPTAECATCGVDHHAECLAELGKCAACRALVPRPGRRTRRHPTARSWQEVLPALPHASALRLQPDDHGEEVRVEWNHFRVADLVLIGASFLVCPPLTVLFLVMVVTRTRGALVLREHELETFTGGVVPRWRRFARDGLSRTVLTPAHHPEAAGRDPQHWFLHLGLAGAQEKVMTQGLLGGLSKTDLAWLVDAIERWRVFRPARPA